MVHGIIMNILRILASAPDKWRRRTNEERLLLVEAFVLLAVARIMVVAIPFRFVSRFLGTHMDESGVVMDDESARTARLVGQAVRSAANNTPWQSVCLPQAMAGQWMLRHRNISATVYFGVMKSPQTTAQLSAHAWLRCGPRILTGADGHRQFTVVSTFATNKRNG